MEKYIKDAVEATKDSVKGAFENVKDKIATTWGEVWDERKKLEDLCDSLEFLRKVCYIEWFIMVVLSSLLIMARFTCLEEEMQQWQSLLWVFSMVTLLLVVLGFHKFIRQIFWKKISFSSPEESDNETSMCGHMEHRAW